jgi:hypothetical protein
LSEGSGLAVTFLRRQSFSSQLPFWQRLLGRARDGEVELVVEPLEVGVLMDSAAMASVAETSVVPTITHGVAMALKVSTKLLHSQGNSPLTNRRDTTNTILSSKPNDAGEPTQLQVATAEPKGRDYKR